MAIFAYALTRLILVSSVVLAMLFALQENYHVALGFAVALLGYAYLLRWGDVRIEDAL